MLQQATQKAALVDVVEEVNDLDLEVSGFRAALIRIVIF